MSQEKLEMYGGQAVIEGVMMRGRRSMAIAVRTPEGDIKIHTEPLASIYSGGIAKIPFVRGLLGLWDALGLGMRAITWSADVAAGEEIEFGGPLATGTIIFALALGIGLFFLTPAAVGELVANWLGLSVLMMNLVEGLVRLVLIIGYIGGIALLDDIRELYRYHGAEHKTINAFEAGDELTPEVVGSHSLYHPRCGTAFLLILVLFSILLYSLLPDMPFWAVLLSRLVSIPILAAVAYEYLRFTANYISNPLIRVLAAPGLAMQRLTTREPSLEINAVAIAAFKAMREAEVAEVIEAGDHLLKVATPQAEAAD